MGITSQSLLKIASVLSVFQLTQSCKIRVYKGSTDNYETFACSDTAQICSSGLLNVSRHSICIIHPYGANPDRPGPEGIADAVLKKGQDNCLSADWSPENGYVIPLDFHVVTAQAAAQLIEAFINMSDCLPPELLHIYGISIGTQLACAIAKAYGECKNSQVNEIVGCDPAKMKGLFQDCDSTCASQMTMMLTDHYYYGTDKPSGPINVWFNRDTYDLSRHQPGCPVPKFDYYWNQSNYSVCNHQRAAFYRSFIIQDEICLFRATKAASTADWVAGKGEETVCLKNLSKSSPGEYFISTSPFEPYGLGEQGAKAVTQPKL